MPALDTLFAFKNVYCMVLVNSELTPKQVFPATKIGERPIQLIKLCLGNITYKIIFLFFCKFINVVLTTISLLFGVLFLL